MTSVWDDPDLKFVDEFVKLEKVGDRFAGRITNIRSHRFDDGSVAAQITFIDDADGVERTWSAGQVQAKRKLAEVRPEKHWHIEFGLTNIEKRGTKTLKHIDIEAWPTADTPATTTGGAVITAPPAGAPLACPAGIDPGKWAAMTAAQRQGLYTALGLDPDVEPPPF